MSNPVNPGADDELRLVLRDNDPQRVRWTSWLDNELGWTEGAANEWVRHESGGLLLTMHFNKAEWATSGKTFVPGMMMELGFYQQPDSAFLELRKLPPDSGGLRDYLLMQRTIRSASEFTADWVRSKRPWRHAHPTTRTLLDRLRFGRGFGAADHVYQRLGSEEVLSLTSVLLSLPSPHNTDWNPDDKYHRSARAAWKAAKGKGTP